MRRDVAEREAARRNHDPQQVRAQRWFAREVAGGEWSLIKVAGLSGAPATPPRCSIEAKPRPAQPDDPLPMFWASLGGS